MNPLHILAAGAGLFYLCIVALIVLAIRRCAQSGSAWHRTTGRIQSFGVSEGIPAVSYSYEADGRTLTGRAFVPGPSAKWSTGLKLPKSLYLHDDGRMRFEPNSEVDVFYNPSNPEDAVLIPGVRRGSWVTMIVRVLVAAIVCGLCSQGQQIAFFFSDKRHVGQFLGALFFLFGMLPLSFGIGYLETRQAIAQLCDHDRAFAQCRGGPNVRRRYELHAQCCLRI